MNQRASIGRSLTAATRVEAPDVYRHAHVTREATRRTDMNTIQKTMVVAALLASSGSFAADPGNADNARAQYDAERARCMSGTTGQDQASCLRSAGAAYDALREGRLRDSNDDYRANALSRCKTLPPADRADCASRVDGEGIKSGSVKGGGDIKETVTTIPAAPSRGSVP